MFGMVVFLYLMYTVQNFDISETNTRQYQGLSFT